MSATLEKRKKKKVSGKVKRGRYVVTKKIDFRNMEAFLESRKAFALDLETKSQAADGNALIIHNAEIDIIIISCFGRTWVIPIGYYKKHLSLDWVLPRLSKLCKKKMVAIHNRNYDASVLENYGIKVDRFFCTMVAAFMYDENVMRSLDIQAKRWLGVGKSGSWKAIVKKYKKDGDPLPMMTYAAKDGELHWRLFRFFYPRIKERANSNDWHILNQMLFPLLKVVVKMQRAGIKIDVKYMRKVDKAITKVVEQKKKELFQSMGCIINLDSNPQLRDVFFKKLKFKGKPYKPLKISAKTKQPSCDSQFLEYYVDMGDPIASALLDYRKVAKLQNTYTCPKGSLTKGKKPKGMLQFLDHKDVLHPSYNIVGADTMRFTCSAPPLQTIPRSSKDESDYNIRKAFMARSKKTLLIGADFSQLELRITAHFSQDPLMIDVYCNQEGGDLHKTTEVEMGVERPLAKNLNFGTLYHIGPAKFGYMAKISEGEARKRIRQWFNLYRGIKEHHQELIEEMHQTKRVLTLMGRQRRLPRINSSQRWLQMRQERQGINAEIQGSAAEIVDLAILRLDANKDLQKMKVKTLLQVHDELLFEAPKRHAEEASVIIKDEMEKVPVPWFSIPLIVDPSVGRTWHDVH